MVVQRFYVFLLGLNPTKGPEIHITLKTLAEMFAE
jgi:hypothetical protein